jgi:hypothetical protein
LQQEASGTGVRLFKYVTTGVAGNWEPVSANAQPRFYDNKQDSGGKKQDWFLEVEAGEVDVRVDDALSYDIALRERRVTFNANDLVFAMRFPTAEACSTFCDQLRDAAFYNTYGYDYGNEAKRGKEFGEDQAGFMFADTHDDVFFEPMDVGEDSQPAPEELHTPEKMRERHALKTLEDDEVEAEGAIMGIVMGAGKGDVVRMCVVRAS